MNQAAAATADPLLDTDDAAEYLGVLPTTLQNWRIRGKGPAFLKLGPTRFARVRYRLSAVEAYLLEGSPQAPPTGTEMPEPRCKRCGMWPVTPCEAPASQTPDGLCDDCREDEPAHDYFID